ncbi:MAG: glycosyltransferase [Dehalococcoidales bacterium]|nr:glycosyltransferase [Dehalococcoidales bacterium]
MQESDWLKRNMHQQHHLAELLALRGHEIRVIDYEVGHKLRLLMRRMVFRNVNKIYDGADVTVIRPGIIGIPGLDYLSLIVTHRKELVEQIRDFNPDVIVGFGILNSYLACSLGKPFIYYWIDTLHDLIPFGPFRMLGKAIEQITLSKSHQVLAINSKLAEYIRRIGGRQVDVLGAGINHERFNKSVDGSETRLRYGFKDTDCVLFYMGWLYRFSGLDKVIERMAEIGDDSIKLIVVGDGDSYDRLTVLAGSNAGNVLVLGKQPYDKIPQYIAASDVCILPAAPDEKIMQNIVPIKVYEYLAMGKPVVSTRLPGVVAEFGKGVLYADSPDDVVDKARAVKHGSVTACVAKYAIPSWGTISDQFEKILKECIDA